MKRYNKYHVIGAITIFIAGNLLLGYIVQTMLYFYDSIGLINMPLNFDFMIILRWMILIEAVIGIIIFIISKTKNIKSDKEKK